jgi:hypothetical protein
VQTYNNNSNNYRGNVAAATDGRSNYTKPSPFKKEYSQSHYVSAAHHSAHKSEIATAPSADANKPVIVWGQGMSLAERLKRAEAELELEKVLKAFIKMTSMLLLFLWFC